MAKTTKTRTFNKPMIVAGILFYLTLVSICLTSGLYAKYLVSDSAEDSARVAKFSVTETATQFSSDLVVEVEPGTLTKEIEITNASEVAIDYTVTIKNTTNNVPFQFSLDTFSDTNVAEDTYTATCSMASGEIETHSIKVILGQENAQNYIGMVDMITIDIVAEQID